MLRSPPAARAALVSFLLFSGLAACTDDDPEQAGAGSRLASPRSSAPASPPVESTTSLLYLEGYALHRLELEGGADEALGRLPSVDATASPGGDAIAYVVAQEPSPQDEDFIERPELRVRDLTTGEDTVIGPGHAPLWHADGTRLAYLEPAEQRSCEGEVCEGGSAVVIADIEDEQRRTILSRGVWSLLGWLGDDVVVADQAAATTLLVDDDSSRSLDVAPSAFWGASPDGTWVAAVDGDGFRFTPAPGSPGRPRRVDIGGRLPGEGAWSPTADLVGTVLLAPGRRVGATVLGLVGPGSGLREVPRSAGASGPVLWSPGGESFVYTRSAGRRGLRLEAVHCRIDDLGGCRPLFSWAQGVALLGLAVP